VVKAAWALAELEALVDRVIVDVVRTDKRFAALVLEIAVARRAAHADAILERAVATEPGLAGLRAEAIIVLLARVEAIPGVVCDDRGIAGVR